MFATINICCSKHYLVMTKVLLWQAYFWCNKHVFCHDKTFVAHKIMFVVTKYFRCDKSILSLQQKTCFVATKMILAAAPANDPPPPPPPPSFFCKIVPSGHIWTYSGVRSGHAWSMCWGQLLPPQKKTYRRICMASPWSVPQCSSGYCTLQNSWEWAGKVGLPQKMGLWG